MIDAFVFRSPTLEKLGAKLVWSNPSSTLQFYAQTVVCDLTGYDYYLIVFRDYTNQRSYVDGCIAKCGHGAMLSLWFSENMTFAYRPVEWVSSGLEFGLGTTKTDKYSQWVCVPLEIYGIKGVRGG